MTYPWNDSLLRSRLTGLRVAVAFTAAFALFDITWGFPGNWYPDSKVRMACRLLEQHTLNPHWFHHPSLHLHLVSLIIAPIAFVQYVWLQNPLTDRASYANLLLAGRLLSVAATMGTAALLYLLSSELIDRRVAAWAAAFFATNALACDIAHQDGPDATLVLLMTGSIYASLRFLSKGRLSTLVWTSGLTGLAISTKQNALALLPSLLYVVLAMPRESSCPAVSVSSVQRWRLAAIRVGLAVLVVVAAFFIGSPYALMDRNRFVGDMLEEWGYRNQWLGASNPDLSWIPYIGMLARSAGLPVLLLAAIGTVQLPCKTNRRHATTVILFLVPYFIAVGSFRFRAEHYLAPMIPLVALTAAVGLRSIMDNPRLPRMVRRAVLVTSLVSTGIVALASMYTRHYDTRYAAESWLRGLPRGTVVAAIGRNCYLPNWPSNVEDRQLPEMEIASGHNWDSVQTDETEFSRFATTFWRKGAEYVLVTSLYTDRFTGSLARDSYFPERRRFVAQLLGGRKGYHVVFAAVNPLPTWLRPPLEYCSPEILVLQRTLPAKSASNASRLGASPRPVGLQCVGSAAVA